jgi:hypothetical protein
MGEQKKKLSSSSPSDVVAILTTSINNVGTLPKKACKANDTVEASEGLQKGESQSQ